MKSRQNDPHFRTGISFHCFFSRKTRKLSLPRLISDGMVVQRDAEIRLWGSGRPGEKIEAGFCGKTSTAVAAPDGKWELILPKTSAGGPFELVISSRDESITIKNVCVGDVWICSGQSNMQLPMSRVKERYAKEMADYRNPNIRQFTVPEKFDYRKETPEIEGGAWEPCGQENISRFSAAGFFFAKSLYGKYGIPLGLINASVGGAPCEAFMSKIALAPFPGHISRAKKLARKSYLARVVRRIQSANDSWHESLQKADLGLEESAKQWFDPEYDDSRWPLMTLPCFWDENGLKGVNGSVWFRKHIEVPADAAGCKATLYMGTIVDSDTAWINGVKVGETGYRYPPRIYAVPENLLVRGKNTVAVRVVNTSGRGGFIKGKPYMISGCSGAVGLEGDWRYGIGAVSVPLPHPIMIGCQPIGLFNGMIAPLARYRIKGVVWYQGESNVGRADEYRKLFPALIRDWRARWKQGDFPFVFVQLASFQAAAGEPVESAWAELRDAQLSALSVSNTAMAVAIDAGEWNDLHPANKKTVGERLALAARRIAYSDESSVTSGPVFASAKRSGGKVIVSFSDTGGGLVAIGGGELAHFAVAGVDGNYKWARAVIAGDTVSVWSELVSEPVFVRYAWADNPEGANLYNAEGLPASPFAARADDE